jgi:hypothetical protein
MDSELNPKLRVLKMLVNAAKTVRRGKQYELIPAALELEQELEARVAELERDGGKTKRGKRELMPA